MNRMEWIAKVGYWKSQWPVIKEQRDTLADANGRVNLYNVLEAVNQYSTVDDVLMGDAGSISYAGPTALNAKAGQRLVFSPAQADMGWALPGSIGVALAGAKQVIAIIGDGSFMSNLQELAVVTQHNLNIKFIILNNNGYLSIKNTQSKYYGGRVYGTSSETGLWFPDFGQIAQSFKMPYHLFTSTEDINNQFSALFAETGPMLIDCMCMNDQEILPAQGLKDGQQAGLHDLTPFLPDEEIAREMIIDLHINSTTKDSK